MEQYTCYCTRKQTKKAFEFGAPIKTISYDSPPVPSPTGWVMHKGSCCKLPTAEQMISWLEKQGIFIDVSPRFNEDGTHFFIYYVGSDTNSFIDSELKYIMGKLPTYSSRKEATLAAIDAALDYLTVQSLNKLR